MNVSETGKFTSNVSGETYEINHKLNRDDSYLIYLSAVKNSMLGKQYLCAVSFGCYHKDKLF